MTSRCATPWLRRSALCTMNYNNIFTMPSRTGASMEVAMPRGGRASRQKGNRVERAIVAALQEAGFAAERIPLSGSAGGRFSGDITMPLLGVDRRVEVKARGDG